MFLIMSLFWHLAPYCSLNPILRNGGIVNKTGGPAGSKVRYYCKPGYRMIGHNNATCRRHQNGMYQWDSPVPICHGKRMFSCWACFYNFIAKNILWIKDTALSILLYAERYIDIMSLSKYVLICVLNVCRAEVLRSRLMQSNTDQSKNIFSVLFYLVKYIPLKSSQLILLLYYGTFYKIQ